MLSVYSINKQPHIDKCILNKVHSLYTFYADFHFNEHVRTFKVFSTDIPLTTHDLEGKS